MEIKVYDESGKIINIIPMYQVGGPVLPQYTPTETSMYRPQQSANTSLEMSQRNLEFENQRAMQNASLDMQRNAQLMSSYQFGMQQRQQQAREERYLKQLDLQNRKLELEEIKIAQGEFQNLLDMDNDKFLEGDDLKIQEQMKLDKMDDESFANLDLRDPSVVYDAMNKRRIYMSKFKDAYANKKAYSDGIKILDNDENDKMIEQAAKNGYLDIDAQQQYTTSKLEYRKALEEFRKTGDKTLLDNAKQHYETITKYQTFINEDIYNKQVELEKTKQLADIAKTEAEAIKTKAEADFQIANKDVLADLEKSKLDQQLADAQMKSQESSLYKSVYDKWKEENPNPTYEEFIEFKNRLDGVNDKGPKNINEYVTQEVNAGRMTLDEAMVYINKNSSSTTTSTTYKTDLVTGKPYVDEGTKRIYNGYSTKDTGEFLSGFYGPSNVEISMNKNAKEFKDGKITVDSSGNLTMNEKTLEKIFNLNITFWDTANDCEQVQRAVPGAVCLGGDSYQIPPSPQPGWGNASSGVSGTSSSVTTTTTNRYTGTGGSTTLPSEEKRKSIL